MNWLLLGCGSLDPRLKFCELLDEGEHPGDFLEIRFEGWFKGPVGLAKSIDAALADRDVLRRIPQDGMGAAGGGFQALSGVPEGAP